jgi:hypothetical protein
MMMMVATNSTIDYCRAFEVGFCSVTPNGEPDFAARFCMANQNEVASEPSSLEGPQRARSVTAPTAIRAGDIVGCGALVHEDKTVSVFFTLNGALCLGNIPFAGRTTAKDIFAVAVLRTLGLTMESNFGTREFAFPIKSFVDACAPNGLVQPASALAAIAASFPKSMASRGKVSLRPLSASINPYKKMLVARTTGHSGATPLPLPLHDAIPGIPVIIPPLKDIPQAEDKVHSNSL